MGKAFSAARKIFAIMDEPSKIDAKAISQKSDTVKIKPENMKGKIEFKDVWFRYPTRKQDWVLRGLNLTINPKETVALVGESGCGKSTFVALLMRFYDVDFGEILIDGVNIQDYDLHDYRFAMSMVMQEPILFNYIVLENILYGKRFALNSEVLKSAEVANAIEFIKNFDDNSLASTDLTSTSNLVTFMNQNKKIFLKAIGEKRYLK